jgi:hypothetical protein
MVICDDCDTRTSHIVVTKKADLDVPVEIQREFGNSSPRSMCEWHISLIFFRAYNVWNLQEDDLAPISILW